jgi:esterase/lipase superfamily enzyme
MPDYVMSVRAVRNGAFVAEVGPSKFLEVPDGLDPSPSHAITANAWYKTVRISSVWINNNGEDRGDILFIIHGYNTSETEVMERHRRLKDDLVAEGFKGVVVSFDWPSDDKSLAYLPDRHRAKATAFKLVSDGIAYLSGQQTPTCTINVHALGHSTGAYVMREAFDDADDTGLPNSGWSVSQIIFAAGDVSSGSMSADDSGAVSIYRHSVRLTNYFSRHDEALDLSNVKRLGTAPRAGRIGLPDDAPQSAVNIDCTDYYEELTEVGSTITATDSPYGFMGMQSHSWYFGNRMFTKDLFCTLIGINRTVIPTRVVGSDGKMSLKHI